MFSELVQLSFDKIMQTRSYTVIVLNGEGKRFAIYTDPTIGRNLQLLLTGTEKQRPLTHDLMHSVLLGYEIQIMQVVINDVQDTTYFARIFLEQELGDVKHVLEIDARPSDSIMLALMNNAPVFCTRDVLDKAIPIEDE